jgi:hypothetical protein
LTRVYNKGYTLLVGLTNRLGIPTTDFNVVVRGDLLMSRRETDWFKDIALI